MSSVGITTKYTLGATNTVDIGHVFAPNTAAINGVLIYTQNNVVKYGGSFTIPSASTSNPNNWYQVTMSVNFAGNDSQWSDTTQMLFGIYSTTASKKMNYWLGLAGRNGTYNNSPWINTIWLTLSAGSYTAYIYHMGSNGYTATVSVYLNNPPPTLL
jgi:hypothetical protein